MNTGRNDRCGRILRDLDACLSFGGREARRACGRLRGEDVSKLRATMALSIPLGHPNGIVVQAKGEPDGLSYGGHGHLLRHGADRGTVSARDRDGPDRRSLHHGGQDGGTRAPSLRAPKNSDSLPLRHLPDARPSADRVIEIMATHGDHIEVKVPRVGTAFRGLRTPSGCDEGACLLFARVLPREPFPLRSLSDVR